MTIFDGRIKEAIDSGIAKQVVIADREGFVVEQMGDAFSSDILAGTFLQAVMALERVEEALLTSSISEFVVRLDEENLIIACRSFAVDDESYHLIMVVPLGCGYRVLSTHAIRTFKQNRRDGVNAR